MPAPVTLPVDECSSCPERYPATHELFEDLVHAPEERDRARIRTELIELYWGFAARLARRFRNRGEPEDDLVQVASIGLIKAIDGFDPDRGTGFTSYAIPTILGELRRHFRDKGWDVRVPRRYQELRLEIAAAGDRLTHELARIPSTADLAAHLAISEHDVRESLAAGRAYTATSLHRPLSHREDGASLGDLLSQEESGYAQVEACAVLRAAIGHLAPRERHIIGLRFYHQLTQSEIAAEVGMSQMHVSRLLSRSLDQLRATLVCTSELSGADPAGVAGAADPRIAEPVGTQSLPTPRPRRRTRVALPLAS